MLHRQLHRTSNRVTLATAGAGSRKVELIVPAAAETEKIGLGYALTGFISPRPTECVSPLSE